MYSAISTSENLNRVSKDHILVRGQSWHWGNYFFAVTWHGGGCIDKITQLRTDTQPALYVNSWHTQ